MSPTTTGGPWVLEPCPEIPKEPQRFPGHVEGFVTSPSKRHTSRKRSTQAEPRRAVKRAKATNNPLPSSSNSSTVPAADSSSSQPADAKTVTDVAEAYGLSPPAWVEGVQDDEEPDIGGAQLANEPYEEYVQLVDEEYVTFVQVTTHHYVVQGFDVERRIGTNSYYHLEARKSGDDEVRLSCLCPEGKRGTECFHKQFYNDFREMRFRTNEDIGKAGIEEELWIDRFSVACGSGSEALRSRTIVTHEGSDSGDGKWICVKCPKKRCVHIRKARVFLRSLSGKENDEGEDCDESEMQNIFNKEPAVDGVNAGSFTEKSISYLPIMPPVWATLPEDPKLYPRPDPKEEPPSTLPLDALSRSACTRHFHEQGDPTFIKECTVYTLTGRKQCMIELQACPGCPASRKCFIGADPRNLGYFNYNNSIVFSHELLDEYTSRFTSSETPFTSFVQTMARVYQNRSTTFIGEDLFRAAWFAFASLQELSGDMSCPQCGETPETVIWDGVTLAFGKRHLRDTLQPPTYIPANALTRTRVRCRKLQWLPHPGKDKGASSARVLLAKWIRKWGNGAGGKDGSDKGDSSGNESTATAVPLGPSTDERRQTELLLVAKALLEEGASALATLLFTIYGRDAERRDWRTRRYYRMLFEQLSANESTVQMVNTAGLEALKRFIAVPTLANASQLADIPALMLVVECELRSGKNVDAMVEVWESRELGGITQRLQYSGNLERNRMLLWPATDSNTAELSKSRW
ncbi:hypothetical protein VNI00_001725 [Paramarasmius palmivorus]|uniref:HMG domain-containing protein n=1 Tax=Paramarasmius palmivorus TaxID=297713 RepID=A0AAW0E3B5_9AGAR